jgi:hypothetical protein
MALINMKGQRPNGDIVPLPISGSVFTYKGPIAVGANMSSDWFETTNYNALGFVFLSDKTGYYTIEYSEDKTNLFVPMITVQYDSTDVNARRKGAIDQDAQWCRITWYNNSGAIANLSMRVNQKTGNFQPSLETLGGQGAFTRLAQWVKAHLHLPDSGGVFGDIWRTNNSLNVNVTNQPAPTDVSLLATKQNQTNGQSRTMIVNGNNDIYGSQANPFNVAVSNATPNFQYAEDSISVDGEMLTMAGVVRKDAAATLASADGDRTELQVNSKGALRVETTTGAGGVAKSYNYGSSATGLLSATGLQTLKASGGSLTDVSAINTTSSDMCIQFFLDVAGTITLGQTAPSFVLMIDANVPLNKGGFVLPFANNIKFAITTTFAGSTIVSQAFITFITL